MKLGVCVPYRNRETHLAEFSPRVHKFLTEQGIEHKIYFAHQCDDKLFNRGKMKNIAAKTAFDDGCDYIVWHTNREPWCWVASAGSRMYKEPPNAEF